jgi:hypothetical protein
LKTETSYGKNLGGEGDLVREKCLLRPVDAIGEKLRRADRAQIQAQGRIESGRRRNPQGGKHQEGIGVRAV